MKHLVKGGIGLRGGNGQVQPENVYLLPHTIDYYQKELTRLLEFERYKEAVELLRFLLQCRNKDPQSGEEWQSLLDWLLAVHPETQWAADPEPAADVTEKDLLKHHLKEKASQDPAYAEKLLLMFSRPAPGDKLLLALEQLRYMEHPDVDDTLKRWLSEKQIPAYLQFVAFQTLKQRGAEGTVRLRKNGEILLLEIVDVPESFGDFPQPFPDIIERVKSVSSVKDPNMEPFAEQTWQEFLAYIYGTAVYHKMTSEDDSQIDAWASAFHYVLLDTAFGFADEGEIREQYGITRELEGSWKTACEVFRDFAVTVFPPVK